MFRIARLAAESMMKFTSKMPLVLLYLLTGALVVYSMGLAFTSNFNMGNLMVWLLTAGVTAYAIWHKPLHAWLHAPGLGRVVWWILVAAGICYALLIGFVAVSGYANPPTGQEKVMIVLGAGLRRDRPSTLLRYRLDKAYAYAATHPDVLIITSGGQQAIDLMSKAMLDPGDTVIVEGPSFIGSLNTFRTYQAHLAAVPMQSDGMDLDALEHSLKTEKNVKFIYIISTFQNPSGYTTSLEKRRAILELARKYDVLILEDSPYFELRYEGEYVPNLKSLDTEGRVLFAGSYSKILSAGIRLGYAIGHRDLIAKLVIGKQATDVHTNLFFQVVAAEYMSRYDLDAHIEKARGI